MMVGLILEGAYHPRKGWRTVRALVPGRGRALCLYGIFVEPQGPLGPVHRAMGWPMQAKMERFALSVGRSSLALGAFDACLDFGEGGYRCGLMEFP